MATGNDITTEISGLSNRHPWQQYWSLAYVFTTQVQDVAGEGVRDVDELAAIAWAMTGELVDEEMTDSCLADEMAGRLAFWNWARDVIERLRENLPGEKQTRLEQLAGAARRETAANLSELAGISSIGESSSRVH